MKVNRRRNFSLLAALAAGLTVGFALPVTVSAQGMGRMNGPMMGGPMMGGGMMRGMHGPGQKGNPVRHRVVMRGPGVPAPYATMKNPTAGNAADVKAGAALYEENCASCHGKTGEGDGEAGSGLEPRPANLAFIIDKPIATDGFLMWAIADGGEPLGTAMPAFKDALSATERWQIIDYLRKGLVAGN